MYSVGFFDENNSKLLSISATEQLTNTNNFFRFRVCRHRRNDEVKYEIIQ